MIGVATAKEFVLQVDRQMFSSQGTVIIDRATEVFDNCIIFHTNTEDFALDPDTDNVLIGTPRYLVDRRTGSVHILPSYASSQHFVELFDAGRIEEI